MKPGDGLCLSWEPFDMSGCGLSDLQQCITWWWQMPSAGQFAVPASELIRNISGRTDTLRICDMMSQSAMQTHYSAC